MPLKKKPRRMRRRLKRLMGSEKGVSALNKALEHLGRREYYREELKQKLKSKGYPSEEIEAALDRLQQGGQLSELRYLEAYIFERQRKLYGPNWIRAQLSGKGFDDQTIAQALRDDTINWYENMRRCYDKKFGADKVTDAKEKVRRRNYLYRRGFGLDLINKLFSEHEVIQ